MRIHRTIFRSHWAKGFQSPVVSKLFSNFEYSMNSRGRGSWAVESRILRTPPSFGYLATGPELFVMIGEKLGHYRLTAKIGEGGMGVVYRAQDEELNREVAVKVLAAGMLEHLGKDHLLKEAQTASALNHPNICTVYQIGRVDDGFYLVMELVEGQPLNEMARSTKLTTEAVTRYGVQIADALAHAHDRQIVHRDLKGANVVITHDGRVKVLDFGLARRLDKATVDAITRSLASVERDRSIVGTLPYMAPEVLTGETGGYQSDIWALGVLLYEAVTGQLPFGGSTAYGLSAAILHELPRPLPPSVPPGLSAVIMRCLAKDLKDRFQRAGEIRSTLETIQSAAIVSEPRREEPTGPRTLVLRGIKHLDVKNGDVLLLVGTTKGAFLARSKSDRKHWDVAGPYFHGHAVYSLGVRQSQRPSSIVGLDRQPTLGHVFALERRFRQDLDQPARSQHQVSAGVGSVAQEYLEDNAGACGGAGQTLLRRGAGRAVRVTRCGRIVVAGARSVRSSASATLDARAGRFVFAHDPAASDRHRADACRHFRGRRLPDRRWRPDVAGAQPGHPRDVHAGAVSGVRAMRAQDRSASGSAGSTVLAKPLGAVSVG